MKDVSIIIINYNSSKYTLECIDAVIAKTSEEISYEIIVVDNNSAIEDYKNLKQNFPYKENIQLHRSNINTGFGGGNMFGAQSANSDYLLFLNNDAMLLNDCLGILLSFMKTNPKVGVCTAQNFDENNKFVPSFDHNKGLRRLLFGRGFLEKNNPTLYPKRKKEYTEPLQVNWVNGAFLFFDAKAFSQVGGFDANIFLYWEEMDICHRLKNAGFESILVPEARILHYQGVSTGSSKIIDKEAYISYLYVLRKNFGYFKSQLIRVYLTFALLLKPKKWFLLPIVLDNNPLSQSLKTKQKITFLNEN